MNRNLESSLSLIISAIVALWTIGGASTGQNFDETKVSQIKKGETTEARLIEMFGQPHSRGINSDGMTSNYLRW